MPKLTEQQNEIISSSKKIITEIEKNRIEKYPKSLDVLAHNLWEYFPEIRNEKLEKIADKKRLTEIFEITEKFLNTFITLHQNNL
jgi:hypothetical protein